MNAKTCFNCQQMIAEAVAFCAHCGQQFRAPQPPPPPPPPGSPISPTAPIMPQMPANPVPINTPPNPASASVGGLPPQLQSVESATNPNLSPLQTGYSPPDSGKSKMLFIVIALVFIILLASVSALFLLRGSGDKYAKAGLKCEPSDVSEESLKNVIDKDKEILESIRSFRICSLEDQSKDYEIVKAADLTEAIQKSARLRDDPQAFYAASCLAIADVFVVDGDAFLQSDSRLEDALNTANFEIKNYQPEFCQ